MNAKPSSCRPTEFARTTDLGDSPGDVLRTRVEAVLRADSHLQAYSLSCRFHDGVLILLGTVGCYYHKQIAQTIVANVDGVEKLANQIEVVESSRG